MKEIDKQDTPGIAGGYIGDGGCIPGPTTNPVGIPAFEPSGYPKAPNSPWVVPDTFVIDPSGV